MNPKNHKSLDSFTGTILKKNFKLESRRSFLAKMTRLTMGLAGISILQQVPLFAASPESSEAEKRLPPDWNWCGLHGYICGTGNCSGGQAGTGSTRAWNACCFDQNSNCWKCCEYIDQCGATIHTAVGCSGVTPSGSKWCGANGGSYYICTRISCRAQGVATQSACNCGTTPNC